MDLITLIIIAVAIALDPLPLVPFILVLTSKRGVRKGAGSGGSHRRSFPASQDRLKENDGAFEPG